MQGPSDKTSSAVTTVFVVVSGTDAGAALANGLARQRARVALLTDRAVETESEVTRIETSFASRENVAAAFSAARQQLGCAQVVVHSSTPQIAFTSTPIEGLSYRHWGEVVHVAVKDTIYCLQAAYEHFDGRGGSIVVFGPSVALVGAPGLAPFCMALEAQRSLAKSAARQWGRVGIRVNWVAIGAEGNYPELSSAAIPPVPELGPPPPPLGRVPDIGDDVADLIGFLSNDVARAVTGTTVNVDGGSWMVP